MTTLTPAAYEKLVRYIQHERPEWTRLQIERYIAEQERLDAAVRAGADGAEA